MRSSGLNKIFEIAKNDNRTIFIGSDLGFKVLDDFRKELPNQFFMEGISEANIIGMSAGMALNGKIVYVNTIASFLVRRSFEQIALNLSLENLKVRLFANGGGYIYGPMGPTHTTIEDVTLMMALPNMSVIIPADKNQMLSLLPQVHDIDGPVYIRVARDNYPNISENLKTILGEPLIMQDGGSLTIFSNGYFTHKALELSEDLSKKNIKTKIVNLHTLRPLNTEKVKELVTQSSVIITMEENISNGGIYSIILELCQNFGLSRKIIPFFLPNRFIEEYGEQDELLKLVKLDRETILSETLRKLDTI